MLRLLNRQTISQAAARHAQDRPVTAQQRPLAPLPWRYTSRSPQLLDLLMHAVAAQCHRPQEWLNRQIAWRAQYGNGVMALFFRLLPVGDIRRQRPLVPDRLTLPGRKVRAMPKIQGTTI